MFKKLLSGLFGSQGSSDASVGTKAAESVEYKEYLIISQPDNQSGQYRVSGWIRKPDSQGGAQEHRFERSDMLPGREACDALMVSKAQRYIDEVGDAMFEPDPRRDSSTAS
ncbi:MAG: HlyU family transcriptional regulator [Pseudomonadota bacterium]|jgi:hypothetical protein|uniref:HlyU family transcriptional regulator n=1 Tax=Vreelandella aquamarina TaxID=77097 RepID=UPI001D250600|nr:HlyU family transcriptional regulator [Halomonas sp.]MEC8936452.1 HlyU family transcriptional regulator [Pseudomonadota bacterium]MEC9295339.1 HlyU family transcriptional regulator [Pseudomonadota bacterium]NQY75687.1 hypothetical protein [Halomonas sp.]|tara:strand:+ start:433 stop:765 length:333 start_codon:yes stop_codon:yes gene_type:complete